MKIGLFGINFGAAGEADAMITIAKAAEDAALESVWTGEGATGRGYDGKAGWSMNMTQGREVQEPFAELATDR